MNNSLLLPSITLALLLGASVAPASKATSAAASSTAAPAPAAAAAPAPAASSIAAAAPETAAATPATEPSEPATEPTTETAPEPAAPAASAQETPNADPEAILGDYIVDRAQMKGKVRVTRDQDGSFSGRIFYVENSIDPKTGQKMTDSKNPDKSLRSTPCDRIMILWGLRYDAGKQCWTGGKVYDPTYGIRANATVTFAPDGRLKVTGTLMGISESVYWQKLP